MSTEKKETYTAALKAYVQAECSRQGVSAKRTTQFIDIIINLTEKWRKANPTQEYEKKEYNGCLSWGKYKGKKISKIAAIDPGYLRWAMEKQKKYLSAECQADIRAELKKIADSEFSDDE